MKKRRLPTAYVPQDMHDLHQRIIDARDQIHAHSDLTVMDAKLHLSEIRGMPPILIRNNVSGLEEFQNIGEIQRLIEMTLANMYEEEIILVTKLPT